MGLVAGEGDPAVEAAMLRGLDRAEAGRLCPGDHQAGHARPLSQRMGRMLPAGVATNLEGHPGLHHRPRLLLRQGGHTGLQITGALPIWLACSLLATNVRKLGLAKRSRNRIGPQGRRTWLTKTYGDFPVGWRRAESATPALWVNQPVMSSHVRSARSGSAAVKWLNRRVPTLGWSMSPMRRRLRAARTPGC
jgi:hypothetical protein